MLGHVRGSLWPEREALIIRNPSLELRWLQRKSKEIPLPILIVGDLGGHAAGLQYKPWDCHEVVAGHDVDRRHGIIAVDDEYCDRMSFESILAHEWRHQWQDFNCLGPYDWPVQTPDAPHKQRMVEYFTTSKREQDALFFEVKFAADDYSVQRLEWVREYYHNQSGRTVDKIRFFEQDERV